MIAENRRSNAHIDWPLILMVAAISLFGVLAVCVASYTPGSTAETLLGHIVESSYTMRQCFFLMLAPIVLLVIMNFPYDLMRRSTGLIYVGSIVLVFLVAIFNRATGVKQWLDIIWGYTIQPTEFAKLAIILMLAKHLAQSERPMGTVRDFIHVMSLILGPGMIILLSGETGSLLVIIFLSAIMMYFSGVDMRLLLTLAAIVILMVLALYGLAVAFGIEDYRINRILAFLNPELSPQDDAYQQLQSEMTIGAGGLWGIGMFVDGSMSQLNYVPADWTDFIYATIGEAFGFVGCTAVLLWYLLIILRMLYLAAFTRDKYGMLIICGVIGMLLFHVFENIGMTLGLMPITGIPLPFLSYGGSNMVTNMGGIALVLNVTKNRSLSGSILTPQTRVNPYTFGRRVR